MPIDSASFCPIRSVMSRSAHCATRRSDCVVPRSHPERTQIFRIFVLSASLGLVCGVRPLRAAGCHVPDRPVLGSSLAWEQDADLQPPTVSTSPVPLVLKHPPCSGEVPQLVGSSGAVICAMWQPGVEFAPFEPSAPLPDAPRLRHRQPLLEPIDRPPRLTARIAMKAPG
jgi:hypothetical protein